MEVTAKYNFARVQPRKVRLVARTILKLPVKVALSQLRHRTKKAAKKLLKLIESAVANAENNYKLNPDNLIIKSIIVDSGPAYRRQKPRSRGRAVSILRRTSHLKVVLSEVIEKSRVVEKREAKAKEEMIEEKEEKEAAVKVVRKVTRKPMTGVKVQRQAKGKTS